MAIKNDVQIYDPSTGLASTGHAMAYPRLWGAAVVLKNGKILVTGGANNSAMTPVNTAEIYDPTTGDWTPTANTMAVARMNHTMALMSDGRVAVVGGWSGTTILNSWEIFDPATNRFGAVVEASSMQLGRFRHTMTPIGTDTFLIAGGIYTGSTPTNSLEIFDYNNHQFIPVAAVLSESKTRHTAVTLLDGNVLIIGGATTASLTPSAKVDLFNVTNRSITPVANMNVPRYSTAGAVVLSDGKVLVVGGRDSSNNMIATAEVYDPVVGTWSYAATSYKPHGNNGLVALDTGKFAVMDSGVEVLDPTQSLHPQNVGIFRVAKVLWDATNSRYAFWLDNPAAVEEGATLARAAFYTYDSILPGDYINFLNDSTSGGNKGAFKVVSVNEADLSENTVDRPTQAATLPQPTSLASILNVVPAEPFYRFATLEYAQPDPSMTDTAVLRLTGQKLANHLDPTYGTQVVALGKLGFPIDPVVGVDGYSYNTGLISEVAKVVHGDPDDRDTYPGVAAEGSTVHISGPMVRRIVLALELKIHGDANSIKSAVQNAVASFVNNNALGKPLAFSGIISAAQDVTGVDAVAVTYPTYNQFVDSIVLQPNEKALVLNPTTDIAVSIVGA